MGKGLIEQAAEGLAALLLTWVEAVGGQTVQRKVFGEMAGAELIVLLCFLVLTLAVHGIAAAVLRSRIRRTRADSSDQGWRHAFWNTLGKPLYLLIWVYGVYFAAMPLLLKWNAAAESHPVRRFFDTAFNVGVFIAVLWAAFRFTRVLEALFTHFARRANTRLGDLLVPLVGKTLRVLVPILGIILGLPLIGLSTASSSVVSKISGLLIIGCIAWVLFQAVALLEKVILSKYDIQAADNLEARKVYTQVQVISKTLYFLIGLFTVASMLMLFEEVRRFGTSILASAGVVGIIIGFAAQRTIANLFAGFQLAMTQPIRLDDVVIVEGEWGRVEEITLTYVVIKIWDQRRLVVPLSHFIEKPFQNWTRVSADIMGTVFVYADYTLPVGEIRYTSASRRCSRSTWNSRWVVCGACTRWPSGRSSSVCRRTCGSRPTRRHAKRWRRCRPVRRGT
jgi:small-conductance mechanosensitive channel